MSATGSTGFTLIEMLVVLAVAALIAGLGFPAVRTQIAAQQWRTSVAAAGALLRTARARAVRTGTVSVVTADGAAIRSGDAPQLDLPRAVTATASRALWFYGDGSSSGGTLVVAGGARAATFRIVPATGLIATP